MITGNEIAVMLSGYKQTLSKIDSLKGQVITMEQIIKYIDEPRFFGDKRIHVKGPKRETIESILKRLNDHIASLYEKREFCEKLIESVENRGASMVLYHYYICGLTMEKVADKALYSRTHCWRLWKKGLESIAKACESNPELQKFIAEYKNTAE